eukprot:COSAG01_NODE_4221_length_5227_cov_3.990445_3_plen_119_part_00
MIARAVSPIQKAFVECEEALAGDVGAVSEVFRVGYQQLWFSSCATETLEKVVPVFDALMESELAAGIDMARMAVVIARYRRRYLSAMEDSPADQLLWPCIKHFLYHLRDIIIMTRTLY